MRIDISLDRVYDRLSNKNVLRAKLALANQALADMNPFVPMKEGILRTATSVDLDGGGINYHMPYAGPQFYGFINGARIYNYTTPGTGSRWDLRAKAKYMSDWERAFVKGMGF